MFQRKAPFKKKKKGKKEARHCCSETSNLIKNPTELMFEAALPSRDFSSSA